MAVSPRIFVSYRREDASGYSGRLYDNLKQKFPGLVFRDVDSLEPGDDFAVRIEELLGSAEVMIAVIGRGWATDESGHRRIDEPDDWLRLEVGAGLRRNIRVIPVIVGGAKMPQAEELPDDLKALALRNSLEINDRDWESAQERLFATIERVLGLANATPEPSAPIPEPTPPLLPAVVPLALVGAGMLAVGLFLRWDSEATRSSKTTSVATCPTAACSPRSLPSASSPPPCSERCSLGAGGLARWVWGSCSEPASPAS